jgi:hypothetical protein
MPVDSLAAVDGHFLFKVVKMSNLTRGEKAAYAIIAKLESERDALRKQLDHGDEKPVSNEKKESIAEWKEQKDRELEKRAALNQQATPEGYQLVQIVPTHAMMRDGIWAIKSAGDASLIEKVDAVYSAMLAVADKRHD